MNKTLDVLLTGGVFVGCAIAGEAAANLAFSYFKNLPFYELITNSYVMGLNISVTVMSAVTGMAAEYHFQNKEIA